MYEQTVVIVTSTSTVNELHFVHYLMHSDTVWNSSKVCAMNTNDSMEYFILAQSSPPTIVAQNRVGKHVCVNKVSLSIEHAE